MKATAPLHSKEENIFTLNLKLTTKIAASVIKPDQQKLYECQSHHSQKSLEYYPGFQIWSVVSDVVIDSVQQVNEEVFRRHPDHP